MAADFKVNDRVRHVGMTEDGVVQSIDRDGALHVVYDRVDAKGNNWAGIYDEVWFRIHSGLLVNLGQRSWDQPKRIDIQQEATRRLAALRRA